MDIVLVGFVAGLTFGGWRTGFLHRLAGLAFMAIAFVLGAYLRGPFGDLVTSAFPNIPSDYAGLLGYVFVFPVALAALHLVSYPFLRGRRMSGMTKELDRALGAVMGFVEGVLILSAAVVILDTYFSGGLSAGSTPGLDYISSLTSAFNSSVTVQLLRSSTVPLVLAVLGPLLPSDISSLVPGGVPGMPGIPGLPGSGNHSGLPGLP
jgi:hypothetical protein